MSEMYNYSSTGSTGSIGVLHKCNDEWPSGPTGYTLLPAHGTTGSTGNGLVLHKCNDDYPSGPTGYTWLPAHGTTGSKS